MLRKFSGEKLSRILICASKRSEGAQKWTSSVEETLHSHGLRKYLNPSLLASTIDPFLLNHPYLSIGFFNWASQQPGYCHTSETYQSVLKSLSISRKFDVIETLLKQIRIQKQHLDPSVYGLVSSSLISGKKTLDAFRFFKELIDQRFHIEPDICNALLSGLVSDEHLKFAESVLDIMIQRNIALNNVGFGVFVGRYCQIVELEKTLYLLDKITNRIGREINGSIIAALIIHGLCQASRTSDAGEILEKLRIRNCKPDFLVYRIAIESFRSIGRMDLVVKFLKQKRKLGVAPRINDYQEFIFGLIKERHIKEAKDIGEAIVNGDFPIEDDTLNALIGSISNVYPDSAVLMFEFMIKNGRFPSVLTIINLSRNLGKNNKFDEMCKVFEILTSKGYFSDLERYNVMISFLCKAGKVREAYGAFKEMRKNGLNPDIISYNSLMEACCREDLLRPAKKLWDEMFANGCHGNQQTYNILIKKFSEVGEVSESLSLFQQMLERKVNPNTVTYSSLIKGLCRELRIDDAYEIYNKSRELEEIKLLGSTLNILVLSLCKEGKFAEASKVLHNLSLETESMSLHIVLLKSLANAGEIKMATEHIDWINNNSSLMLQTISDELTTSLSSSPKPNPISKLLQAMHEKGISSTSNHWMNLSKTAPKFKETQQNLS